MATEVVVGRPKRLAGIKPTGPKTIGVRSTPEWADWIDRAAKYCRTDIAKLVDASVAEYVKGRGFTEPPPERIP
jgi:hypothetical protein